MNLPAFALRNIRRHGHRTLVTTAAMGFAGMIMILYAALMEGLFISTERNALTMNIGDVQIHAHGYREDPDLYTRIEQPAVVLERLQGMGLAAAPRLYGFALAAAGSSSAGVQLRGIDVQRESRVTQTHRHLLAGAWLGQDDPQGVVLGRKLARTLAVGLGDEVVLVSQAADGSMANELYRVRGVLKSVGEEIDRGGFYMLESSFRQLMGLSQGVHEIVLRRADPRQDIEVLGAQLSAAFTQYEVRHWRQLQPLIAELLDLADVHIYLMTVITYIAVVMVVLNAMLMSVFERIREFGVMKAIGFGPLQLFGLIYAEALIQIVMALAMAALLGVPLALYFEEHGIDLTTLISGVSLGGVAIDPIWRAELTYRAVFAPMISLLLMGGLAVLYPALKAALIRPVRAIHYQ